jgi:hypothetical protein
MTEELGLLSPIDNRQDGEIDVRRFLMLREPSKGYTVMTCEPAKGVIYIAEDNPGFISGQIRMRGRNGDTHFTI